MNGYTMCLNASIILLFVCGEIDPQAADTTMTKFRAKFQGRGIGNPKAIFNADETGLFFK